MYQTVVQQAIATHTGMEAGPDTPAIAGESRAKIVRLIRDSELVNVRDSLCVFSGTTTDSHNRYHHCVTFTGTATMIINTATAVNLCRVPLVLVLARKSSYPEPDTPAVSKHVVRCDP
jgi:hypothetical protein